MPTLPNLTINNQTAWDRIYAAFDGDPAVYRAWLKKAIIQYVLDHEINVTVETKRQECATLMDTAT